jgi:hypothetical protein
LQKFSPKIDAAPKDGLAAAREAAAWNAPDQRRSGMDKDVHRAPLARVGVFFCLVKEKRWGLGT